LRHALATMTQPRSPSASGLPHALAAYLMWGLLPLYLHLVHAVPPFEFVGWRTLCTLPVCGLILLATGQWGEVRAIFAQPALVAKLALSALLIGANWLIYVVAIQAGHLFAASLGYYISPLLNVALGTLFLGERLSRAGWMAVGLAFAGVAVLAAGAGLTLGISLSLAATFAGYGLMRKALPVAALPGLTVEACALIVPGLALITFGHGPQGTALAGPPLLWLLVALAGVVTAVPLLLYTHAARRLPFSTLGFLQYLAPTMVFLLGLLVFHEPLQRVQLASFALIWAAVAVFCWDLWAKSRVLTLPA
jgi:chloramphenicol-sensitive protein RarD